jgi:phospholipid/cholesterol/gamma-HCH transport system substrate-binding protein
VTDRAVNYETVQRKKNIVVGIFVALGLCALIWLIFKFGDLPVAVTKLRSFQVFVQFPSAPGVQRDTPVRLCGYQIGRVTKVMPPKKCKDLNTGLEYHQSVAVLSIDRKYSNIPSNVQVKLMTRGLGSSYIELKIDPERQLEPMDPNRPYTVFLGDKMLLQGSTGMTSEFFPAESQEKLEELVDSLRTLVGNANDIIGDSSNKENFKSILANRSVATKQATETLKEVQEFSAAGTETLKHADAHLKKLVLALVDTSEQLSETIARLRVLIEKVSDGQGTVGKLVNEGRLYESTLESSEKLQVLMEELRSVIRQIKEKGLRSIY